MKQQDWSSL